VLETELFWAAAFNGVEICHGALPECNFIGIGRRVFVPTGGLLGGESVHVVRVRRYWAVTASSI